MKTLFAIAAVFIASVSGAGLLDFVKVRLADKSGPEKVTCFIIANTGVCPDPRDHNQVVEFYNKYRVETMTFLVSDKFLKTETNWVEVPEELKRNKQDGFLPNLLGTSKEVSLGQSVYDIETGGIPQNARINDLEGDRVADPLRHEGGGYMSPGQAAQFGRYIGSRFSPGFRSLFGQTQGRQKETGPESPV